MPISAGLINSVKSNQIDNCVYVQNSFAAFLMEGDKRFSACHGAVVYNPHIYEMCTRNHSFRQMNKTKDMTFYPMTKTQFMQKRVWEMWDFHVAALDVSYKSWDESKNPCPWGNRLFLNSVNHQNLKSTRPVASCFSGPDDAPHCEIFDFHMDIGSCYSFKWQAYCGMYLWYSMLFSLAG